MSDTRLVPLSGSALIQSVSSNATMQDTAQIPQTFTQMSHGALIKGFVINRDTHNNPILRTPHGDVMVKSDVFLKTGSEVVMRINQQGPFQQAQARIVSVDGMTIQQLQQQQAQQAQQANQDRVLQSSLGSPERQQNSITTAPSSQPSGILISGVLLETSSVASNPQALASILHLPNDKTENLLRGSILQFRVVSSDLNLQPHRDSSLPTQTQGSLPQSPQVTTQYQTYGKYAAQQSINPQLRGSLSRPTPLGEPVNPYAGPTKTSTSVPPPATTTTPTQPVPSAETTISSQNTAPPASHYEPSNRAGIISTTVIGSEPNGETTVRTPIGTIRLFTASAPPLNSVLQLEVFLPQTQQPIATPLANDSTATISTFSGLLANWDTLEETQQAVQHVPDLARDFTSRIPNTKSKLVNSVLFFLSALKSGDVSHWLGPRLHATLQETAPNIASRLARDFTNIRTMSSEQPDQPWQMLPLPLLHNEELRQARLYIRQDHSQDGKTGGNGTRFVIEVNMSQLGEIQLDGLTKLEGKQLSFDLVVRSQTPLPKWMHDGIKDIFKTASEATRFRGDLRFQPSPERFIRPLEENLQAHADEGSIIA